jgi:hypothetical protein
VSLGNCGCVPGELRLCPWGIVVVGFSHPLHSTVDLLSFKGNGLLLHNLFDWPLDWVRINNVLGLLPLSGLTEDCPPSKTFNGINVFLGRVS